MISPQGYLLGENPKAKNPFWDDGEASDVQRIFATATVDDNVGTPQVQTSKSVSGNTITFAFAFKNLKGRPGNNGTNGRDGSDGFSPTIQVTDIPGGHRITIFTALGSDFFDVMDGTDGTDGVNGTDGAPGFSPTANVEQISDGAKITVTDQSGTTEATVYNGTDGSDGAPGFSPTVSITDIDGGHRITVTDATGSHSFDVMDGRDGTDGVNGTNGRDGVSPTARVEQVPGENALKVIVTDAGGTTEATITGEAGAPGADGFSPIASVTQTATGADISITDKNGTTTATITNGRDGTDGAPGAPGTPGQNGADGITPVISATASVTDQGTTGVTVTKSGTDAAPSFDFAFTGIGGQSGVGCGMLPAVGTRYTNKGTFIQAIQALVPNVGDKKVVFLSGYPLNGSQIMNEYRNSNSDYIQISLSSNYSFYRTILSVNTGSGAVTGAAQSPQQGSAVALAKGYYLVSRIMWSGSTLYPETEFITITPLACEMENDNVTPLFYASMLYYSVADSELYAYVGRTKKMQYYDSSTIYMDRLSNVLNSPLNVNIAITMATV